MAQVSLQPLLGCIRMARLGSVQQHWRPAIRYFRRSALQSHARRAPSRLHPPTARPHGRVPSPEEGFDVSNAKPFRMLFSCVAIGAAGVGYSSYQLSHYLPNAEPYWEFAQRHRAAWKRHILENDPNTPLWQLILPRADEVMGPSARKIMTVSLGVCAGVFLLWRIPSQRVQRFLLRNMRLSIVNPRPWTIVTAQFSHQSLIHFVFNAIAGISFIADVGPTLGLNSTLCLMAVGGASSALLFFAHSMAFGIAPFGLGFSGIVMALAAFSMREHPDNLLSLIFLPGFTFTADSALRFLLVFETAGMLILRSPMAHAAHLGGLLAGLVYHSHGQYLVQDLAAYWRDMRA